MPVDDGGKAQDAASLVFEREKWEAEQRRLDRDFELRERELALKDREARRARLWNPLAIAILGAAVAAAGNAYVSLQNSKSSLEVETLKAEFARIFELVKTGDPDIAAKNLRFLLDTGLIQTETTVASLRKYLDQRKAGEGFSLPPTGLSSLSESSGWPLDDKCPANTAVSDDVARNNLRLHFDSCFQKFGAFYVYFFKVENLGASAVQIRWDQARLLGWVPPASSMWMRRESQLAPRSVHSKVALSDSGDVEVATVEPDSQKP